MSLLIKVLLFIAATEIEFTQAQLMAVNSFSNSVDLEWDFQGNYTKYSIVIPALVGGFPTNIGGVSRTNEITVNVRQSNFTYIARLVGQSTDGCPFSLGEKRFNTTDLHIPVNVPRQNITTFEICSKNSNEIILQWNEIQGVSHYRLRYQWLQDCLPNQNTVYTTASNLTIDRTSDNIFQSGDNNGTYLFALRVFNYTSNTHTIFPKAQPIEFTFEDLAMCEDAITTTTTATTTTNPTTTTNATTNTNTTAPSTGEVAAITSLWLLALSSTLSISMILNYI